MLIKKTLLLSAVFASLFMVGCASTDSDDSGQAAADAAAAEAARLAAEREAAERAAREAAANLQTVYYFDFDKFELTAQTQAALDAQIAVLRNTNNNVRLEGHADERGTREYNMALGEKRANAVANYLVVNGIARYRIETVSFGEERPVATGSDEASFSQNRRVELK